MGFSIGSLVLALAGLLALSPMNANAAGSTFDTDLEGWEAVGIDIGYTLGFPPKLNSITLVQNDGDMVHEAAGGNPGGYARLTDAIEEPSSMAGAPDSFLNGGDLTPFIGGTFSFDHRLFDTGTPVESIAPYSVFFISGDPIDLNALVWTAPAPAGATDWVHFDITLAESDLTLIENVPLSALDSSLPSFTPAQLGYTGSMTFEEIMGDVDDLLVAFELVNNGGVQNQEHGGIDNVQLVPGLPADTDGDTIPDSTDNCVTVKNESQTDSDGDEIGDACDNCRNEANAGCLAGSGCTGGQLDDDLDGYGNVCDADFTEGLGDGFINVSDLLRFLDAFGQNIADSTCPDSSAAGTPTGGCARYDLTGEGPIINVPDLLVMIGPLFGTPQSSHGCAEDDTGVVRCPLP